jgi:hypothetical protein
MPAGTPYALGRFRGTDGDDFCGAVVGPDVIPLATLLPGTTDIESLLAAWPSNEKLLDTAVDALVASQHGTVPTRSASELTPLAPFLPGQIFQSGANYKTHVIQLMVAAAAEQGDEDPERTLREATALMTERAEHGTPYVFVGLPSAVCGPQDDVVLPAIGAQHDWELELGVVIGTEAYRVSRDEALGHVDGYTIVNDITTRGPGVPPGHARARHRLARGQELAHVPAPGPVAGPRAVRARPDGRADHAQAERRDHAGRDHRRHDLRDRRAHRARLVHHPDAPG